MESQFEIKWTNFESKFDGGKQQKAFEALAYHLFCLEFGLREGLFRYKNQAGIETDPAEIGEEIIGFQAKYYDASTNLSGKKSDLVDAIKKTKRKNPSLTRLLFYINKEFSESTEKEKKEPDYKIEIEQAGKDDGITIEWRVKSHIEKQLARPENKYVAEYYFGGDRSVWKFIENIEKHTENLLESINTEISYKGEKIYFSQKECEQDYEKLISDNMPCIIVSGEGGTGKTAFVKHWIEENSPILYVWRLSEFNVDSLQNVFANYGNFTVYDFLDAFITDDRKKYVLLDSAESIYEFRNRTSIIEFLNLIYKNGWKLLITIRTAYLENFKHIIKDVQGLQYGEITISIIDSQIIKKKLEDIRVLVPNNNRVLELLAIPFYLNEFLHVFSEDMDIEFTVVEFMKYLWDKKILGEPYEKDRMHIRRGKVMYSLVSYKVTNSSFYIRERKIENLDVEALHFLIQDEIVAEDDKKRCYVSHDIYEEWAWINYIGELYEDNQYDIKEFMAGLIDAMVVRRCFRQWVQWNLEDGREEIKNFILTIMEQPWVELKWKDEILIAILNSKYSMAFLNEKREECFADGAFSLKRIIWLLRTAGKTSSNIMQLTVPTGFGWGAVISLLYRHYDKAILYIDNKVLLGLLKDWTDIYHKGSICKAAGLIAYKMLQSKSMGYDVDDDLIDIILGSAGELIDEIKDMFQNAVQGERKYKKIFVKLLTTPSGLVLVNSNPELVVEIAKFYWLRTDEEGRYGTGNYQAEIYGVSADYDFKYWPASAYQTPIYWLLKRYEENTIEFVIESLNHAVINYVQNMKKKEKYQVPQITIFIDGKTKKQYINQDLWWIYRGMGNAPDLLVSMLAAVEKHLLESGKDEDNDVLFRKLKDMILSSNSVAITAIGMSLIEAYPDKLFKLAYYFLEFPEFVILDRRRLSQEMGLGLMIGIGAIPNIPLSGEYVKERKEALEEKFRKNSFEITIMQYQIGTFFPIEFKKKLWELLDKKHKEYETVGDDDEIGMLYQRYYIQMDIRRQEVNEYDKGEIHGVILEPKFDERQSERLEEVKKNEELQNEKAELGLWVRARFDERVSDYSKYTKYERNPELSYQEMQNFDRFSSDNPHLAFLVQDLDLYICCVLIRDFGDQICQEIKSVCIERIYKNAEEMLKYPNQVNVSGDGNDATIVGLVSWIHKNHTKEDIEKLLKLYLVKGLEFESIIVSSIKKYAVELIDYFTEFIILYKSKYDKLTEMVYDDSILDVFESFWNQNKSEALNLINNLSGIKEEQLCVCSLKNISFAMELTVQNDNESFWILASNFLDQYTIQEKEIKNFDYVWKSFELLAHWLFICDEMKAVVVLKKLSDTLKKDEWFQRLLHSIICEADIFKNKKRFWIIWNAMFEPVNKVVKSEEANQKQNFEFSWKGEIDTNNILLEYLLAGYNTWKKDIKQWELVSSEDIGFWERCCKSFGYHKATLLGIGHFINHIGFEVARDRAITWIYEIVNNQGHLWKVELLTNTIYYLENYMKTYCDYNMKGIKTDFNLKKKVFKILDFMVEKESAIAFMLRDEL